MSDPENIEIVVTTMADLVRIDVSKAVSYLILSKAHAVQLACMLLEHADAKISREPPIPPIITPG